MRLLYFTESYPFGLGEEWKTNELSRLRHHFDEIVIIPHHYGGNRDPLNIPWENVIYQKPLYSRDYIPSWSKLIWLILRFPHILIPELVFAFSAGIKGLSMLKKVSTNIDNLLHEERLYTELKKPDTIAYFFWGRKTVELMACGLNGVQFAVRYHNYDLLKERYHRGYIPFQRVIMKKAHAILAISNLTKNYIHEKWGIDSKKIHVSRLGTLSKGHAKSSMDSKIVLASCSNMIEIKRLDRIVEIIKRLRDIEIDWFHIGGGPLFDEIKKRVKREIPNVKVDFIGQVKPKYVKDYYVDNQVDLFINTSEYEGVPVSIMEAMSAGIPVIAPNIGGVCEIVNSNNGFLLSPKNVIDDGVAAIKEYASLNLEKKQMMRKSAYDMFNSRYDAHKNADELAGILKLMLD